MAAPGTCGPSGPTRIPNPPETSKPPQTGVFLGPAQRAQSSPGSPKPPGEADRPRRPQTGFPQGAQKLKHKTKTTKQTRTHSETKDSKTKTRKPKPPRATLEAKSCRGKGPTIPSLLPQPQTLKPPFQETKKTPSLAQRTGCWGLGRPQAPKTIQNEAK